MPSIAELPLFPLGTVLFPGGLLPLRIFEVRYLDMIGRCHKAGEPFGVVALTEGHEVRQPGQSERFRDVGTLAVIESLEQTQPGLLTIECCGTERFRIRERRLLKHGLWVADVDILADDIAVPVPSHLASTAESLGTLRERLLERGLAGSRHPLALAPHLDDSGWVANRWGELLPAPADIQYNLMSLDSPLMRLELVADLLTHYAIAPSAAEPEGPGT